MFVHETHSFIIMINITTPENPPDNFIERKFAYFDKAVSNIGAENMKFYASAWMLNDVMYSSAEDVFDIINSEVIRLVGNDKALAPSEREVFQLKSDYDNIFISEFVTDNIYRI